jgi:hypothetical protein
MDDSVRAGVERRIREIAGPQKSYPEVEVVDSTPRLGDVYFTAAIDDVTKKITIPDNYTTEPLLSSLLAHELGHFYMQPTPFASSGDFLGPTTKKGVVDEMEASVWGAYKLGGMETGVHNDVETIWEFGGYRAFRGDKRAFKRKFRHVRDYVAKRLGVAPVLLGLEENLNDLGDYDA